MTSTHKRTVSINRCLYISGPPVPQSENKCNRYPASNSIPSGHPYYGHAKTRYIEETASRISDACSCTLNAESLQQDADQRVLKRHSLSGLSGFGTFRCTSDLYCNTPRPPTPSHPTPINFSHVKINQTIAADLRTFKYM